MDDTILEQNYISHHGVKGMKWGVRKSGPRSTRAGRKAYKRDRRDVESSLSNSYGKAERKAASEIEALNRKYPGKSRKGLRKAGKREINDRLFKAMRNIERTHETKLDAVKKKHGEDARVAERNEMIMSALFLSGIVLVPAISKSLE